MPAEILLAPSARWKKLHWPLLSIASIWEQLSLLQMEMRPKIATNGAMPLNADVLCFLPRVLMPCQINFNPCVDRADVSFANPPLRQFVWSQGSRNNWTSTHAKWDVTVSNTCWLSAGGALVQPAKSSSHSWTLFGLRAGFPFPFAGRLILDLTVNTCWWGHSKAAVMEGWKKSKRGAQRKDFQKLTGASSVKLWEKKKIKTGNVCKCCYPFIKPLSFSLYTPSSFE